jgi:hypothetical protein
MKYFRHETKHSKIHIYPLVCWHVGSPQSNEKFIKDMVARIREDPYAKWIYLGDAGECNIKASKGDLYSQTMGPGEQLNYFADLVKPIRGKGLFAVNGNHGRRIYKETGLDFDEELALRLGIPYAGVQCFFRLHVAKSHYDVLAHHGLSSGATIASKVNSAKKLNTLVVADAILSAHSHICMPLDPKTTAYIGADGNERPGIKWRQTQEYICGCAYDSRTGYAEEKGYTPILPAHLAVAFHGTRSNNDKRVLRHQELVGLWRAPA